MRRVFPPFDFASHSHCLPAHVSGSGACTDLCRLDLRPASHAHCSEDAFIPVELVLVCCWLAGALPEQQLVVACGVSPRCKLAVVRSGCGLVPAMLDGPELPVSVWLCHSVLNASACMLWHTSCSVAAVGRSCVLCLCMTTQVMGSAVDLPHVHAVSVVTGAAG